MKKSYLIILIAVLLIVGWLFVRFVIGGDEDTWVKNERGECIKHGMPSKLCPYEETQGNFVEDKGGYNKITGKNPLVFR